jgi:hypothetical protein
VAVDPESLVGVTVTAPGRYEVGRAKIRQFAEAIGETSPLCHDVDAARAAGHPDQRLRISRHGCQRVSRCAVWVRHRGQYFFSSSRSGSLRRFLRVM